MSRSHYTPPLVYLLSILYTTKYQVLVASCVSEGIYPQKNKKQPELDIYPYQYAQNRTLHLHSVDVSILLRLPTQL